MAKIVSLIINSTDSNDKNLTTNISYVNPETPNDKLLEFAQMINALTSENYVSAIKITKERVI